MPKRPKITFKETDKQYAYNVYKDDEFIGSLVPVDWADFREWTTLWIDETGLPPWWKVINRDGKVMSVVDFDRNGEAAFETRRMSAAKILMSQTKRINR